MIITPSCCYCCTATGANNDRDTSQFMVTRQIVFKVCVCVCLSVCQSMCCMGMFVLSVYLCLYVCNNDSEVTAQ